MPVFRIYLAISLMMAIMLPARPALAQGWQAPAYPAYPPSYHPAYPAPGYFRPPPPRFQPRGHAPYPSAYRPRPGWAYPPPAYPRTPPPASPAVEPPPATQAPEPEKDKPVTSTSDRKSEFVDRLLPHIRNENQRLSQLRSRLKGLFAGLDDGLAISDRQRRDLEQLTRRYRVDGNPLDDPQARATLLKRVDVIPVSLALAQAANESAWGRSRFATEANNLFGIWTYDKSKGLKPLERDEDKTHLVRKFNDISESIAYYMRTLNSHPAYRGLRDIRQRARERGYSASGLELAEGLEKYSAKGKTYILLIQQLIEQNRWSELDLQQPSVQG